MKFKKIDILLALIIGEVAGWLMFLIGRNLALENPAVANLIPYINYLPIVFPILCAIGLIAAYFLSKAMPVIYQIAKFVLVGGMNFLIDMGVLNLLIFSTGIASGLTQSGFKGISFLVALGNSYAWNKLWTFDDKSTGDIKKEFLQFAAVSVVGLLINVGADYFFVNIMSPFGGMPEKTWAQFSAMLAAAIAMSWNFLGYKFIVFNSKSNVI